MAPPHVPLSRTAPLQNQRKSNIYTASASLSETSPLPQGPSLPSPTLLLPRNAASTISAPAFPSSLSLCLPPSLSPGVEVCRSSPTAAASPREALAGRRRPRAAPASAPAAACACPRPWRGEASPTGGRRTAYPHRCLLCLLHVCSYATSAIGTLPAFATGNPSCWFRSGQLSLIHSRLVGLRLF